ncbi:DnaJ domain-containing protein [Aquibaculum arenosum]|uniref:Molecular chaperone DnaJ n=1 Tax=Aquibaculum arenosum TaxID=3032591 RepID=A0ABT5YKC0_9PROT|nr:DnaJ domain-containing protein [Fodinicurvata sp. CAU 1616]MDF2094689.1 molecular chaperone DnaJ [Fodinicurvata sp. CAU 1616]
MLLWLLVGVALLVAVVAGLRWFANAQPGEVLRALRWVAAVAGGALLLLVVLGAARQLLAVALPLLLPLLAQAIGRLRSWSPPSGSDSGQISEIVTRFLRMRLDHDSGAMEGTVLEGPFRGRHLSELTAAELLALLRDCRAEDEESASVLEAYLDRTQGAEWRGSGEDEASADQGAGNAGPSMGGTMSVEEARAVLGIGPDADEAAIKAAHRRLMQQLHPDLGGSDYLAAKINQAKQVLLGR